MGISAVIDANGRVLRPEVLPLPEAKFDAEDHVWTVPLRRGQTSELPESEWRQFKKVPGVLLAVIPVDSRRSFYAVWGDWLPWVCWIVLGTAFVCATVRRIVRSKSEAI
jgi:apolipoprotein N-acyltransferase